MAPMMVATAGMAATDALADRLESLERRLLAIGGGTLALCLVAALFGPAQFYRSYLLAYLLWLGVALGSLALLMVHHLTGGAWGQVLRRLLESATRTIPLLMVLFAPIALGLGHLYEWADPLAVANDPVLVEKRVYLNPAFFLLRVIVYFAIWIGLARLLDRWSTQLEAGRHARSSQLQALSGAGLVLYGLTATFASIDWVMSLEPHWHSTVYGLLFTVGQALTALAFTIPVVVWLARRPPLAAVVSRDRCQDLGNLLLALVLIWAYLGFSQYLIIWSGNLPEEIPWYLRRTQGGWQGVGTTLVLLHFALPFSLLLLRLTKRTASALAAVAGVVFFLRLVDLLWLVRPPFADRLQVHWLDLAMPVGLGGLWLAWFVRGLRSRPLVPIEDAQLTTVTPHGGLP